jgi:hypothetical protein
LLFSFNFSAYDFCDDCRYFNVFFGVNKMEKFKLKSMRERELIEKVEILERENAALSIALYKLGINIPESITFDMWCDDISLPNGITSNQKKITILDKVAEIKLDYNKRSKGISLVAYFYNDHVTSSVFQASAFNDCVTNYQDIPDIAYELADKLLQKINTVINEEVK